ncbi:cupredoxin domain-containing protein [Bacillaceae bacterium S4-13-58]
MRKLLFFIFFAFLSLVLVACGSNENASDDQTLNNGGDNQQEDEEDSSANEGESSRNDGRSSEKAPVEPTGEVVEVNINATNFAFDVNEIEANSGDTIKINFKNVDGSHGITFQGYDLKIDKDGTYEFVADQAGTFQFYCNVMCGHGHSEMVGTLTVK